MVDCLKMMIDDLFLRFGNSDDPRWKLPEAQKLIVQIAVHQSRENKEWFDIKERRAKEKYGSKGRHYGETRKKLLSCQREWEKRLHAIEAGERLNK